MFVRPCIIIWIIHYSKIYFFNDRKYATTASASSWLKRNCGIGAIASLPAELVPVSKNFNATASVA